MALNAANKPEHMLSVPEIKILLRWFRRNGDFPAPQTRQALLTGLGETSHRGETSRRQQKRSQQLLWFLLRVPSPLFSPLGLQLTIVLTHKGEIDIPAALPCMLWARKNMMGGWEEEYEGSDETRRRRKRSVVEAMVEKQTINQSKNSRLADICHSSNTNKPVAWCNQNTN